MDRTPPQPRTAGPSPGRTSDRAVARPLLSDLLRGLGEHHRGLLDLQRERLHAAAHLALEPEVDRLAVSDEETTLLDQRVVGHDLGVELGEQGGLDPVREKGVRPIAAVPDWRKQRVMWRDLKAGLPDG